MRPRQPRFRLKGWSGVAWPCALAPALLALSLSAAPAETAPGADLVQAHCSGCHSLALVAQNRMTRQGWQDTIRWMQEKQGLWDLGPAEQAILDHLEQNYGLVEPRWRRKPLDPPTVDPGSG
ncbi:MAG: hypothetical protein HKN58_04490 [Xanthomonadales bacterium]|nr:hypothetical protein [Xanthomonadales bacterium]